LYFVQGNDIMARLKQSKSETKTSQNDMENWERDIIQKSRTKTQGAIKKMVNSAVRSHLLGVQPVERHTIQVFNPDPKKIQGISVAEGRLIKLITADHDTVFSCFLVPAPLVVSPAQPLANSDGDSSSPTTGSPSTPSTSTQSTSAQSTDITSKTAEATIQTVSIPSIQLMISEKIEELQCPPEGMRLKRKWHGIPIFVRNYGPGHVYVYTSAE